MNDMGGSSLSDSSDSSISDDGNAGAWDARPEDDADLPYLAWAGAVTWPNHPEELADVRLCPACQSVLPSALCANCGLDLGSARAAELLAASDAVLAAVRHRNSVIGRIRYETALAAEAASQGAALEAAAREAAAREAALATASSAELPVRPEPSPLQNIHLGQTPAPEPSRPIAQLDAWAAAQASAPAREQPSTGASRRPRRSSVQILLLVVGVSLVAVAAVFFLTVAWIFSGIAVREGLVGCVTAATLVTAAVLHRRRLEATAEGVGALGSVLVLLDVWALRSTNTFRLAGFDGLSYWGTALLICAALFYAWHILSGLRVASVSASLVVAPGIAFLVGGLTDGLDPASRVFFAGLGAAIGTVLYRLTTADGRRFLPRGGRRTEQGIMIGLASCALLVSAVSAFLVAPASDWAPLWSFGALAAVTAAHVVVGLSFKPPSALATVFVTAAAVLTALALSLAVPLLALRASNVELAVSVPLIVASAIVLCAEIAVRRPIPRSFRRPVASAAIAAGSLGVLALAASLVYAITPTARALFAIGDGLPARTSEAEAAALLALVGTGLLAVLLWALAGLLRDRLVILAWAGLGVVVLAVAFLTALGPMLSCYLGIGALSLIAALAARHRAIGRYRAVLVTGFAVSASLGYLVSWTNSSTWWIGSVVAIVMLFAARYLVARPGGMARGAMLAGAIVLTLIAAGAAPRLLTLGAGWGVVPASANVMAGLALACVVLQVLVAVVRRGLSVMELRWSFFTLLVPTVVAIGYPSESFSRGWSSTLVQPEPIGSIVRVAVLVAVPILWLVLRRREVALRAERLVALAFLAPAVGLLQLVIFVGAGLDDPQLVAAPIAAVLCCALALAVRLGLAGAVRAADPWLRRSLELGSAAILAPWLVVVVVRSGVGSAPLGWLALLISGIAVLLVAIAPDGLFASRSPRRHAGWVALLLGIAGFWTALSDARVTGVEAYVLPVAGALLVIAELLRRFGPTSNTGVASPVTAGLVLAGLLIAALPIAVTGTTGPVARPIVAAVACGVLLVGATWVPWTDRWWPYLAAIATAATAGFAVAAAARAATGVSPAPAVDGRLEAWLLPFAAALLLASVGLLRQQHPVTAAARRTAAIAAIGCALAIGLIPSALASGSEAPLRPVLVLAVAAPLVLGAAVLRLVRPHDHAAPSFAVLPMSAIIAIAVGSVAVVTTVALRLGALAAEKPSGLSAVDGRLEAWLLPASIALGASGVLLQASRRSNAAGSAAATGTQAAAWMLSIGALGGIVLVELLALAPTPVGEARAITLSWFLVVAHIAAFWYAGDCAPRLVRLLQTLSWLAIALAGLTGLVAIALDAAHPVELVTLPIAVALLVTGWLRLDASTLARSWPWLGPGIVLLLGPSLLLDLTENPLWRVVSLGVVAIGVLVAGVLLRLQAPFLLGCAAVLVHALAQLWPWITVAYSTVPWWLWLGIGGVVLIALAARYEQRIRNFRTIALRIGSLR